MAAQCIRSLVHGLNKLNTFLTIGGLSLKGLRGCKHVCGQRQVDLRFSLFME